MTTLPFVGSGSLPEHGNYYRDDGCNLAPSCLRCPLPVCKYDDPRLRRSARNAAIYREHLKGRTKEFISKKFSRSLRVVDRAIQQQRNDLPMPKPLEQNNDGQLLTLTQLAKKSVIHARKPWPEMKR